MNAMHRVQLHCLNDYSEWRAVARTKLRAGVRPRDIDWRAPTGTADLLETDAGAASAGQEDRPAGRVPPRFVRMAQAVVCHTDPGRFGLLYSLLWRLQKDSNLLGNRDDADVARCVRRVDAVVADAQRMKQELRFRRAVAADGHKGLAADYAPTYYVLERVAPHFARAVTQDDWVITTPYRSARWDGRSLSFEPGSDMSKFIAGDRRGT